MAEKGKKLMVIDTDCGIDDALAIMLALSFKDQWKILAITCCNGNTSLENASKNVLKVLHQCGVSDIPVYKGCSGPIIASSRVPTVHGSDGLGDVADQFSSGNLEVSKGQGVNVLVQLAKQHKGKIHLVALAPLTNIAMAHRMDPEFTSNLHSITFMGGNIRAVGNVTPTAEFNFFFDAEAAHMVVTESKCPVTMVPWETTLNHGIDWDDFDHWVNEDTKLAEFVKKITFPMAELCRDEQYGSFVDCDLFAAAVQLDPESVTVKNSYNMNVETKGIYTSGQVIAVPPSSPHYKSDELSVNVVEKFDDRRLKILRYKIMHL